MPSDDSFIDSFLMLTGDDDEVEGGETSETENKKRKLNNSQAKSNTLVEGSDMDIDTNGEDGTESVHDSDTNEQRRGENEN